MTARPTFVLTRRTRRWRTRAKQGRRAEARSRAPSQRDSSGICSQIGTPKGREAGINQPVSGLQTPAAPYRRAQADVLTD